MSDRLRKEILAEINDAWFNINVNNEDLIRPLDSLSTEDPDLFYKQLTWFLTNPEYFAFLCKHIFKIDILPFQSLILQELYTRKFPMLIASRGAGKTFIMSLYCLIRALLMPNRKIVVVGAAFRQSKFLHDYMENIWKNSGVLRDLCDSNSGPRRDVDMCKTIINGSQIVALPIGDGSKIRGQRANDIISDEFACLDRNTLVETSLGLQKIVDVIGCSDIGLINEDGQVEYPTKHIITPKTDVFEVTTKHGYGFKCSSIHKVKTTQGWKLAKDLTSDDYLIFENHYIFPESIIEYKSKEKSNLTVDEDIAELMGLMVSEGSNTNKNSILITTTDKNELEEWLNKFAKWNPKVTTKDEYIDPRGWKCKKSFLFAIHNTKLRSLLGELGVDYVTSHNKEIPWSILQSPRNIVIAFLKGLFYGDGSCFTFADRGIRRLGTSYYSVSEELVTQLQTILWKLGYLSSKIPRDSKISDNTQWMIRLNGKYAYDLACELNITKFNKVLEQQDYEVNEKFKQGYTFVKNQNKWATRIYVDGKLKQFGQFDTEEEARSKAIEIQKNLPFSLKVKSVEKLEDQDNLYDFYLPETHSFMGNGFTQHNSMSREIFENVIAGFAAVSASPAEQVKIEAAKLKARELNVDIEKVDQVLEDPGNQIVLAGTAYYDFNHFATYWKRWKNIIKSKGDPQKLKSVFGEEPVPDSFNWKDYSITRVPVDLIPRGFMDEAQIARSRATIHNGIYLMEFGACGVFDTPIITKNGIKNLGEIQIGDEVLTHKGRFKKVTKRTYRPYKGHVIETNSYGYYRDLVFTPDHPFWNNDDFVSLHGLNDNLYLSNIKELSNIDHIDTTSICTNFVDRDDFIYPRSSKSKIDNKTRHKILDDLNNKKSQTELSRKYGISQSAIWSIKNETRKPKNSIPQKIKLDYDFGLVMGYYASEGSVGSGGRNCDFALDGHVDKTLEFFVDQLSLSLKNSIGIVPKLYKRKNNNALSVAINSRVFGEVLKYICPGDCYTKLMNHDILFSTSEFLKGFITGIWNGDGHVGKDFATLQLTNENLVNQVKLALSYFGINSSLLKPKRTTEGIIKGRKVKLSPCWKLNISGGEFRKFQSTFYDYELIDLTQRDSVFNDGCSSINKIKDKIYVPYKGLVYNLEVEDDHSYSTPNATVHNCFCTDSAGFFKRTLIESCVASDVKPVKLGSGVDVYFDPLLKGNPAGQYIIGVDPASEVDNFSIVVLEVHPDHRRIVHSWTTSRQQHKDRVKKGLTEENDFYSYCARKIRDLMGVFPTIHLAMDAQGGGIAVSEALHDPKNLSRGEVPIWPIIDEDKAKDTDDESGLHILEMCQFARATWLSEANHGLRKDFEDKVLLLPRFDPITIGLSIEQDKMANRTYDTLEDCVMEIEELKNELAMIEIKVTAAGREHWDTPEVKVGTGKKERVRKDRYSSLLMANMAARTKRKINIQEGYNIVGGFAHPTKQQEYNKNDFIGPAWITEGLNGVY